MDLKLVTGIGFEPTIAPVDAAKRGASVSSMPPNGFTTLI
jgi:hypothetical protein